MKTKRLTWEDIKGSKEGTLSRSVSISKNYFTGNV